MKYFKKILRFAKPYQAYAWLNIIANIFYALFGTLAFVSLMPMLKVLFSTTVEIYEKPVYTGISDLGSYFEKYMNYMITEKINELGELKALLIMISLVIGTFLLKNIFNYLAMFFITFLRNGVLKDLRNALYDKVIRLPISFNS